MDYKERKLLATIAAYGILNHDAARRMPDEFSRLQLLDRSGLGTAEIDSRLDRLVEAGLVSKRNTSHAGYGNSWIEGDDVWKITAKGLIALWA